MQTACEEARARADEVLQSARGRAPCMPSFIHLPLLSPLPITMDLLQSIIRAFMLRLSLQNSTIPLWRLVPALRRGAQSDVIEIELGREGLSGRLETWRNRGT